MHSKTFVSGIALIFTTLAAIGAGGRAAAVSPATASATAPSPEAVTRAIDTGVTWLKAQQQDDGSWSNPNYPALTALGLWALVKTGRGDADVCKNAAAFVAGFAQPDGGIYKPATGGRGTGGLSTYNTAICMTALHAYDRAAYTPVILKARTFVANSQLQGDSAGAGGFGYEGGANAGASPRARADLSNTGWALAAMRLTQDLEDLRPATEKKADVDWDAALSFVEKLQNRDASDADNNGGFGYEAGGARGGAAGKSAGVVTLRGFGSMTYAGLESMIYAQVGREDPRIQSAIAWATRHWTVDENPGMGSKGLYYYYTIMAKALVLAGGDTLARETGAPIAWKQELTGKLLREQKADGSWVSTDNTFWEADPTLVTAYALLTLGTMQGDSE